MRHVVIVTSLLRAAGATGVQTQCRHQLEHAQAHRPDVAMELATPFDVGLARFPLFGIRYLVQPLSRAAGVLAYHHGHAIALRRVLRRRVRAAFDTDERTQVHIHAHDAWSARAALTVRAQLPQHLRGRVSVVLTVHSMGSNADEWVEKGVIRSDGRAWRTLRGVEQSTLPNVDAISYVSTAMRDAFERWLPELVYLRAAVTSNGVRLPSRIESPGPRDLIAIGTLEARKNQSYLLHVLAHCHRRGAPYTLTVVGSGPDRSKLERLAGELGIASHVHFTGYVPRAADLIPAHRALVHASFGESFGNVFLEAMAAGRPVFAANAGAVSEVFADGDGGYYWELDDAAGAARRLVDLLEHREQYERMCVRARARAERFSWEHQYDRLTRFVLDEALA